MIAVDQNLAHARKELIVLNILKYNYCQDQRLYTEGKIVSKYFNISKTLGRGSINPPLYHRGGGMSLRLRPRVKSRKMAKT